MKLIENLTKMNENNKATMSFSQKSYAKINLFLDVIEKLESGYHSIVTVFSEIELFDKIKFSLTKNQELKILSNQKCLESQENLIFKVGIYIQAKYNVRHGALIELEKNIPIAAGLGGGSSNAATTIKGLSKLWGLELKMSEMHEIAANFGSDINFFLEGYSAIGRNRGELIEPLEDEIFIDNILLVNPNFAISSREAYELLQKNEKIDYPLPLGNYPIFNRLEIGICNKYPIIRDTLNLLKENGATKAILSGSGPTMIGFFENQNSLKNAQKKIDDLNFWNYKTTTRRRPKK